MAPLPALDRELDRLGQAALRQDFVSVEAAALGCARALEAALPCLPPAEAALRIRDLLERFESARRGVLVARVRMAERLSRLRPTASYGGAPSTVHTLRMDV